MSTTPIDPPLKSPYREAEKASFFAAYDRLESVGDAARELGLHPQACYRWMVEAGINPRRRGLERRAEFDRLRATGTSRKDAARHVGVHIRTAIDWDLGMRRSNGFRIDSGDRAMGYNKEVITYDNRRARLTAIEQQLDARYLSLSERERIRDLTATGSSIRSIAAALHRSPSSVSRELRRNGTVTGTYEPYAAHRTAAGRRPRPKDSKLTYRQQLREFVKEKLRIHWSPEQICHALVKEHPMDEEMRVSPEAIYQALYLQARGGLKKEVQPRFEQGEPDAKRRTPGRCAVAASRTRWS